MKNRGRIAFFIGARVGGPGRGVKNPPREHAYYESKNILISCAYGHDISMFQRVGSLRRALLYFGFFTGHDDFLGHFLEGEIDRERGRITIAVFEGGFSTQHPDISLGER